MRYPVIARVFFRWILVCSAVLLMMPLPSYGTQTPQKEKTLEGNLSPELENALAALVVSSARKQPNPAPTAIACILDFAVNNTQPASQIRLASNAQGTGAYGQGKLSLPLQKVAGYLLHPAVPGEAIYPASVRRTAWLPGSPIIKESDTLLKAVYPPSVPLFTRGTEYEETTPDTTSGCYYAYKLDRLFILTSYKGRTALLSVSSMPEESSVGCKGAIVDDESWAYVYTSVQGTNINMMGWAETYIYGSASVSVFMETEPGSSETQVQIFKWAKAGWSGINAVKPSHISYGIQRFIKGLEKVVATPGAPTPQALAAYSKKLGTMSDAELQTRLNAFGVWLAAPPLKNPLLSEKDFQQVLRDGKYAFTLGRNDTRAELMKLYVRRQLQLLPEELTSTIVQPVDDSKSSTAEAQ